MDNVTVRIHIINHVIAQVNTCTTITTKTNVEEMHCCVKWLQVLIHTCSGPVVGLFVCCPVDEFPQAGHSMRTNQSVAAESPAIHHSDVQRWVKQLILRQILTHERVILWKYVLFSSSNQPEIDS